MAKIRSLKAEILKDEEIAVLGIIPWKLAVGLIISMADDDGRLKASPSLLKVEIFPFDKVTEAEIGEALNLLETVGFIQLYAADGRGYGAIVKWTVHQRIPPSRYEASRLPAPPEARRKQSASRPHTRRKQSASTAQPSRAPGSEGKGKERSTPTPQVVESPDPIWRLEHTNLVECFEELVGHIPSALDIEAGWTHLTEFQRMEQSDFHGRMKWLQDRGKLRTLAGCHETFRHQDAWLGEQSRGPARRFTTQRSGEMARAV